MGRLHLITNARAEAQSCLVELNRLAAKKGGAAEDCGVLLSAEIALASGDSTCALSILEGALSHSWNEPELIRMIGLLQAGRDGYAVLKDMPHPVLEISLAHPVHSPKISWFNDLYPLAAWLVACKTTLLRF